jgi:Predicted esterase of the alpha/beta hydrolase fold
MKKQILAIHGGGTFKTREEFLSFLHHTPLSYEDALDAEPAPDWKKNLRHECGDTWDVFRPDMPCAHNASYDEWSARFDQYVPHFRDGIVLIGHSLGAAFLLRYLSEHTVPMKVRGTILVGAPIDDTKEETLATFTPPKQLEAFARNAGEVHIFHSTDDNTVPYENATKLAERLPQATLHTHHNYGHYRVGAIPELIAVLRTMQ